MPACRACGGELGKAFLSLGNSPLSNAYLTAGRLGDMEPYYPLDLYYCGGCGLVQLPELAKAESIFSADYAYFSSYSRSWLEHCKAYATMAVGRFGLGERSFVVEVASNDGYLLQYFKERGIPVLGIEPAADTARVAISRGIPTDIRFFNAEYARRLGKRADLIIGNNVLAHNPGLNDFTEGLKMALEPRGVITMEFPHLLRLMEGNQYDTIYHEHYSYFSFYAVRRLFASHGLEIFDVDELPTHGGSLRIYARHAEDADRAVAGRVGSLLEKEKAAGLLERGTYDRFGEKVRAAKRGLLEFLIGVKKSGKAIVGYGAPAKGNTLLNYCGIRTDFLDYTVDLSPHKQGKFLPGTHIPIEHPDKIKEDRPDYILILPWNIKEEVMAQLGYVREWGGKFVVPIPAVEVL